MCVQPGSGLQGRGRPLRCLLEQQQPQVRRWGAESLGSPGLRALRQERPPRGPCAPAAGSAHPPSQLPGRGRRGDRREALSSRPSLLSHRGQAGCSRVSPGRPRPAASAGCGETRKRAGAPESGRLRCAARHADRQLSAGAGLGRGEPRCAPPAALTWGVSAQGLRREPAKHLKFLFLFLLKIVSSLYPVSREHGLGEVKGAGKRKL